MKMLATIVTAALLGLFGVAPTAAQSAGGAVARDASAQSKPSRARTKVLVRPAYPYRRTHSLYPEPDGIIDYPGPNARRVCSGGLVTEYRPSGTVTVPRLNCRWVRG